MIFVHEFREGNDGHVYDNGWWQLRGDMLFNRNGGRHAYTPHPKDEKIESTWDEVIKRSLIEHSGDYRTGWLSPDGRFYGCDYMDHRLVAEYIFDDDEIGLEEKGYCKLYRSMFDGVEGFDKMPGGHNLTEAQWKYLLDNDYTTPEEYDRWS